jgi:glycosyltransferase involved in cell wall biosynthesis
VNGWLVVPGSVHALVKAMEAALDTLPERLRAMGLQGRQAALKAHDVDTEAGTLAGLFRRLTAVTSP